ncbi:hypothetical protein BIY27_10390 [Gibbsiella quercinecans]|nr:hypothetical protein BIY27_10390 [Gibbsiella quercinecans]
MVRVTVRPRKKPDIWLQYLFTFSEKNIGIIGASIYGPSNKANTSNLKYDEYIPPKYRVDASSRKELGVNEKAAMSKSNVINNGPSGPRKKSKYQKLLKVACIIYLGPSNS